MSRPGKSVLTLVLSLAVSAAMAQTTTAGKEHASPRDPGLQQVAEPGTARTAVHAEEIDVQLREAEQRLADAAAQIAELSRKRLPETYSTFERHIQIDDRPMLGVTIGADDGTRGPVEGVTIRGLTPGGAASDAGLRSGDVMTAINDESLNADSDEQANRKLLDFLAGIDEGDKLDVEYLRNGKSAAVEVTPRATPNQVFAFGSGDNHFFTRALPAPAIPGAPFTPPPNVFFFAGGGSWGDMEMVPLTDDLGRYFGTDKGLLVVRAPTDEKLKLRDGDVIRTIDGREPTSVSHAMRILGSYQGGETLKLEIMRDRKKQTLSVDIPDNRSSFFSPVRGVAPPADGDEVMVIDQAGNAVRERT